jgi:thioredoxin-dependent peroxiredoxin
VGVADLYGIIHPNASDTTTVRSVFVIGPDKKVKLTITYPQSTRRNFDEEAAARFPDGWRTLKPYLRMVPQPQ